MLVKVDRMSMAHGLEARVPFLDRELVEFCWRLPDHLKMSWSQGKILLRRAERPHYPKALARVPKKGFNVPIEKWFREGRLSASRTLARSGVFADLLDAEGIGRLERWHREGRRDLAHVLFCLLRLQHI
jgi:asparagine synthase (glutamine-hydrolysing)